MATIITRAGKGSPLENDEVDANFTNLNNDKVETSALNELVDDRVSTLIVPGLGITTDYDDTAGTLTVESDTIEELCKNGTGSTILKGTPVYQTGTAGIAMVIAPADASSAATMPAVGVLSQDLAAEAEGSLILMGRISGVDTSAFSEGDVIYVASGGGYTNTRPTGESVLVQNLGRVTKVNATNGGGVVMGSGRANDVPNLTDGNIFIGNASGTYDKRAIVTADISDLTATATELNYTDGVTSNIQTQLNTKAPLASPTFTGTVTADGLVVNGSAEINHVDQEAYNVSTSSDYGLAIDGTGNAVGSGGQLTFRANSGSWGLAAIKSYATNGNANTQGDLFFSTRRSTADADLTRSLKIASNGDISFYEDTGTTPQFFWDASTESLGIGITAPLANLHINAAQPDDASLRLTTSSDGWELATAYNANNDIDFVINGGNSGSAFTQKLRIDASGNVGIGITPTSKLDVDGNISSTSADLKEIAATISDTAVDVFVYDTRKDSDGGAWRKRTQNTSWYNETLNTGTRGSRKEFPAVALIVAESNQVTIYDGDDPSLPMWMVFNTGRTPIVTMLNWFTSGSAVVSSVAQLNGRLCVGTSGGVTQFDFVEDAMYISYAPSTAYTPINNRISFRNDSNASNAGSSSEYFYFIVNQTVNDVAMTVLPNAPIDAATGLPVPTIAVATNGGVSVIKDNGTVVSDSLIDGITPYGGSIDIWNDKTLVFQYGFGSNDDWTRIRTFSLPDLTERYQYRGDVNWNGIYAADTNWRDKLAKNTIGTEYGAIMLDRADDPSQVTTANQMVAQVASTYNTGWMNGDIKLATLSDTDDTDVTGSELVTNGTFDTDTAWTKINVSISGGQATSTAISAYLEQAITLTNGLTYTITIDCVSGNGLVNISGSSAFGGINRTAVAGTTISYTGICIDNALPLKIFIQNSGVVLDNISVRIAEEDRSVNNNGLQVFGTITKNPVVTGADLVAYSGFSASNYLEQPRNANTEIGTGDAAWIVWVKTTSSAQYNMVVSREGPNFGTAFNIRFEYGVPIFWATNDSFTTFLNLNDSVTRNDGSWHCFVWVKQGTTYSSYADGKQIGSGTYDIDMSDSSNDEVINIGVRRYSLSRQPFNGSIALARFSHTAPTAEQIAKIYEDEKVLFQENAQATLYGSSDAVTALAYDDDTELLHVGTSAGRSVFQGLRRVDNTTDAVGAAISASNGLVAED